MLAASLAPVAAWSGGSPAFAGQADYIRRLTAVTGTAPPDFSENSISSDMTPTASIVAISTRKPLLASDTNNRGDVYVIDRVAGTTELVSVSSAGAISLGPEGNGEYGGVSISDDGNLVAFSSSASNLVVGDQNGIQDIFVHDRSANTTRRVSVSSSGAEAAPTPGDSYAASYNPDVSGNGRYVTFDSNASNLIANDANGTESDVFVHDLNTQETSLVSSASSGAQPPYELQTEPFPMAMGSGEPSISRDGRYVAFASSFSTLTPGDTNAFSDVFVKDLQTGELKLASSSSSGVQGNRDSSAPAITADGSEVVFQSRATNLGSPDASEDVFLKNLGDSSLTHISSFALAMEDVPEWAREPFVSDDGRYVVFEYDCGAPLDGSVECPIWTFRGQHVYRFDRETRALDIVSSDCYGRAGNNTSSSTGDISAGGRFVTLNSWAPLSLDGDTNGGSVDGFLRDMDEPTCAPEINIFPLRLFLDGANFKEVFLTWTDETLNEDHYQLQRADAFSTSWTTVGRFTADTFSYKDRAVTPGRIYTYRVRAVRADGTSAGWSNLLRLRVPERLDRYVAMGDSYSSGEGVEPYLEGSAVEDVNECHRSTDAYSTKVVAPGTTLPLFNRAQQGEPGVSWAFVACSGAVTKNVWRNGEDHWGSTQIEQNRLDEYTELVTISIGGNDAKFGPVIKYCLANACTSHEFRPFDNMAFTAWLTMHVDNLVPDLQRTMSEIRNEAPNAHVVVLGYPHMFPDTAYEQSCAELIVPFGNGEMDFLNQIGDRLNQRIEEVATSAGFKFINPTDYFWDHEICADGEDWIEGLATTPAAFHPKRDGQAAYAALVNQWLTQAPPPLAPLPKRRIPRRPRYAAAATTTTTPLSGTIGHLRVKPTIQNNSCGLPNGIRDGSTIRIRGANFAARSRVDIWLAAPGPDRRRILTSPRTDTLGAFDVSVVLSTTYGTNVVHSLEAKGTNPTGGSRVLVDLVRVAPRC